MPKIINTKCLLLSVLMLGMYHSLYTQRQSVNVNGRQIYFTVAGSGPPVLVFHGWTQTGHDWKPLLEGLETNYQMIYVDLPGHGKSGQIQDDFSVHYAAMELKAFVEKLELRGARGIGYSYGGMLLLEMLVEDPRLFREAVLISTPHSFDGSDHEAVILDSLPQAYRDQLFEKHENGIEQVKALFDPALNYHIDFNEVDVKPVFIPVLIIQGKDDNLTPATQAVELSDWLVSGRLWMIPGKGHDVITYENAGEFQKRLRSFFADF